jgi:hypothetical protein
MRHNRPSWQRGDSPKTSPFINVCWSSTRKLLVGWTVTNRPAQPRRTDRVLELRSPNRLMPFKGKLSRRSFDQVGDVLKQD